MAIFDYQGFDIHYTIEGEGQPILFLHGLGGGSLNWLHQRNHFKKDYQLISIDFPGHGKSEGGNELAFHNYHDLLKTLLIDRLNMSNILLCGLSMGGKVAIDFASRYPDVVSGLFVSSTFAEMGPADKKRRREVWDLIHQPNGVQLWLPRVIEQMGLNPHGPVAKGFAKALEVTSIEFMYQLYIQFLDYEQTDQLEIIHIPSMIIHGDTDDFVPLSCAEDLHKGIANAELQIITGSGHLPNVEQPQTFNDLLYSFVKKVHDLNY